jgi:rod shape-determining protein MreC
MLEFVAISLTIQNHSFHKSKFINSSNSISGFFYNKFNIIESYRNLRSENKLLLKENTKLINLLNKSKKSIILKPKMIIDSIRYNQKYKYTEAIVINNQFLKSTNFLTINKGQRDSVFQDNGVINSKGIIGIVTKTSNKYAKVMSILNENSRINARLKKNSHFGTITWNGKDYKLVQLEDIPIQANIKLLDTIITDGKSSIFPEGIPIGVVSNIKTKNNRLIQIDIKLFNDMSAIKYVKVINNLDKEEIKKIESN